MSSAKIVVQFESEPKPLFKTNKQKITVNFESHSSIKSNNIRNLNILCINLYFTLFGGVFS